MSAGERGQRGGADPTRTETLTAMRPEVSSGCRRVPALFVLLCGREPWRGPSRHSLAGLDAVAMGGGDEPRVWREGRVLHVVLPDRRASAEHAWLELAPGLPVVRDRGSKNGTFVDGRRVERAVLEPSSLLVLGETVLQVRPVEHAGELPLDVAPAPGAHATLWPALAQAYEDLERVAATKAPVLLLGESGVGKEVEARAIHAGSGRRGELVAVNCAALPAALLEAELFGHQRGAFSGAVDGREGLVRAADGGTLFLDEIAELPAAAQAALLRTLQEGEVRPVGASRSVRVDVRLVCATHRDLAAMVEAGAFRADLYARIAGFVARLPPLRERRCDLGLFVRAFFEQHPRARPARLGPDASLALIQHDWPLNVRELMHALEQAVTLAVDGRIRAQHLPRAVVDGSRGADGREDEAMSPDAPAATPAPLPELRARLVGELQAAGGNVSAVARAMGVHRRQVQRWLQRLGLAPVAFRR